MRALCIAALALACGGEAPMTLIEPTDAGAPAVPRSFATRVVSFAPGPGAGFGQAAMPEVVLGPPLGRGPNAGSIDVVSLGAGGSIVVEVAIEDRPGDDFIVFENAFLVADDPSKGWFELGEVAVSTDAASWRTFACERAGTAGRHEGCAGWRPVHPFDPVEVDPLDPARTGGDPFDLARVGLERAGFVRIRDLSAAGDPPTVGFDLDAVGAIRR